MKDSRDPERVSAVRRALERLIELLAQDVAEELLRRQPTSTSSRNLLNGDDHRGGRRG